jgi:hypothetical protein
MAPKEICTAGHSNGRLYSFQSFPFCSTLKRFLLNSFVGNAEVVRIRFEADEVAAGIGF